MAEYTFSLEEVAERIERLPVLFDEKMVHCACDAKWQACYGDYVSRELLKVLHAAIDEL